MESSESRDGEIAQLRAALEFYADEGLYDMKQFTTAPKIARLTREPPKNITIYENPIMHDRGKRAREALYPRGGSDGSAA